MKRIGGESRRSSNWVIELCAHLSTPVSSERVAVQGLSIGRQEERSLPDIVAVEPVTFTSKIVGLEEKIVLRLPGHSADLVRHLFL